MNLYLLNIHKNATKDQLELKVFSNNDKRISPDGINPIINLCYDPMCYFVARSNQFNPTKRGT